MGVTLKDARVEVEKIIGRGSGFVAVEIPFTPRAKRVLELSLEEARQLGAWGDGWRRGGTAHAQHAEAPRCCAQALSRCGLALGRSARNSVWRRLSAAVVLVWGQAELQRRSRIRALSVGRRGALGVER